MPTRVLKQVFIDVHSRGREETPNDPKLSDSPARRDPCVEGGKAEAGSTGHDAQASSLERMVRRCGFPHIAFDEAVYELGLELVEDITAQGFVVVPVEEFVQDHRAAQSDLWGQLEAQCVGAAIANLPSPLWRLALSQWNPMPDNPFAARRSPRKPPVLTETLQAALRLARGQGKDEPIHLVNEAQSETKPPQT